jgi:hypothetical protein
MGSSPVTYNAMFKGGSTVDIRKSRGQLSDNIHLEGKSGLVEFKLDKRVLFVSAERIITSIELFDLSGHRLFLNHYNTRVITENLSYLSSGTYCVKVKSEEGVQSKNIELR